jgi:predicted dienelactone hydrolase
VLVAVTLAAGPPAGPAALAGGPRRAGDRAAGPVAPPDRLGSYGVGYRTVTVVDDTRPTRPLTTAVWYPSSARLAAPGVLGGPTPASYEIAPGVGLQSRVAVAQGPVAAGRFPLVVISHGSAGSRVQFATLAEALASRGYVVAAPDHPGDTMADVATGRKEPLVDLASDRPLDVWAVIDWMLCPDREFGPVVDPGRVAVVGFSFGGLTALASSVGFLTAPPDPRVKVVVGISPATDVLPAALVGRVTVPTLLIGGTVDPMTPVERNADVTFRELTASPDRLEVRVTQATHNSFSDLCEQAYLAADGRVPAEVARQLQLGALITCPPPLVDPATARQVARWYTVAYLERYLRGDVRYASFLTPAAATRVAAGVAVRAAP